MLTGQSFIPEGCVKNMIILLHGYGASGDDLFDIGMTLSDNLPNTAIYSPNAPNAFEMGGPGYQWFGLPDLSSSTLEDGIHKTLPVLLDYIDILVEKHNICHEDVALVGFSQGCMMALASLYHRPLAAVVGLSGMWVKPGEPEVENETPVLLVHGTHDMIVPFSTMDFSQMMLERDGFPVETLSRPGLGHGIDNYTIDAIGEFLEPILLKTHATIQKEKTYV
ncbi:MAG TPA: phospholipase [Holosporales bacterium]|nr:phospholipase [Holosporales bacterium]